MSALDIAGADMFVFLSVAGAAILFDSKMRGTQAFWVAIVETGFILAAIHFVSAAHL